MAGRFHAVSVRTGPQSCRAAKQVKEVRYLSQDAPALPLPGCEQRRQCQCRYRHHDDRREGPRRDKDVGLPGIFWTLTERREPRMGRRATDRAGR